MTPGPTLDPLELSVMSHAFAMIAEEMGTILVRGSLLDVVITSTR